ncbi:MAG: hypothetical protein C0467_21360 [Planctomycetaceae bacterium]|nr:hypothetical protein [Planctomycetaceae bacterium]
MRVGLRSESVPTGEPIRNCYLMRIAPVLLAYAVVLGFGLFQSFGPTFTSGFARMQTERGDGMLNHYILEHSWQSITNPDYCGSLFSPPCFYPTRATLWYSEHLLGVAPIYWGLRVVMPYDFAYQWWQIILNVMNFVSFALVLRWLRTPHILAMLGGYMWAFSLINLDQLKHQQMIPRFAMVLAAYHAWQFVMALGSTAANPARHLNRMMAAVFLQGVTCVNTGWFLVAGLATFIPLAVLLRRAGWWYLLCYLWNHSWRVMFILGGWAGALLIAYIPYFVVNWGQERLYIECVDLMPTAYAWFAPLPGTVWEPVLGSCRAALLNECWLFCGFTIYGLMAVCAVALLLAMKTEGRRPELGVLLAALLTSVVWIVITMKIGDEQSLWKYIRHVPGGTAIRCVSRVYVIVYLFGVLAALVWLGGVTESLRPSIRCVVLGLIAVVCIVEQYGYDMPSFEKRDFYPIADRAAEELKKGHTGYIVPRYTDTSGDQLETVYAEVLGMWAGLRANVPVVNGYSGRVPNEAFLQVVLSPDEFRETHLRKWLAGRFRGRVVLVEPGYPDKTRVIVFE